VRHDPAVRGGASAGGRAAAGVGLRGARRGGDRRRRHHRVLPVPALRPLAARGGAAGSRAAPCSGCECLRQRRVRHPASELPAG
jgi:hypothetical protein